MIDKIFILLIIHFSLFYILQYSQIHNLKWFVLTSTENVFSFK